MLGMHRVSGGGRTGGCSAIDGSVDTYTITTMTTNTAMTINTTITAGTLSCAVGVVTGNIIDIVIIVTLTMTRMNICRKPSQRNGLAGDAIYSSHA